MRVRAIHTLVACISGSLTTSDRSLATAASSLSLINCCSNSDTLGNEKRRGRGRGGRGEGGRGGGERRGETKEKEREESSGKKPRTCQHNPHNVRTTSHVQLVQTLQP